MDIKRLEALLRSHRNQENQIPMEKYMRNQFPFLGIKTPERRGIIREFLKMEKDCSFTGIAPESPYRACPASAVG
jgi:hypothetical protein